MASELYRIEKEEKLSDIARRFGISEEKLKILNPNIRTFSAGFFSKDIYVGVNQVIKISEDKAAVKTDNDIVFDFNKSQEEREERIKKYNNLVFDNHLYRTEMVVGTVLEQVMVDNSTCKSQYKVGLNKEDKTIVNVTLEENHVKSSPQIMQEGMKLIAELDKIKCNSLVRLDPETAKIKEIINYKKILDNWDQYKRDLEIRKTVLKLSQNRKDIDNFISGVESILKPEKNLINDYYNKMFYELFFTKHLMGNTDFIEKYSKTYYSTLFDKEPVVLHFTPTILEETDELVKIRKVSKMDYPSLNTKKIINSYNEKIKPMVQFNFTEYNFSYRETFTWNKKENMLQESHVTVIEEVKNNVQLLIEFNLKRFE